MAPVLSVERFLQAVNGGEYATMAGLFGTRDGPIRGDRREIELQMDLIAKIVRHQDYRIGSNTVVPGRRNRTIRVGVDLTIGEEVIRDVAFLVVQSDAGGWLVEEIDLEAITGG